MGDPFKTLETEPAFGLDLEGLRARFLDASSRCHPDRFTDPIEQADAADQMSRLTEAYRVLRDPEARAHALLARRGGTGRHRRIVAAARLADADDGDPRGAGAGDRLG